MNGNTDETKGTNGQHPQANDPATAMRFAVDALKDRRKDNVENVRTVLMHAVVRLKKDEDSRKDPDVLEATSGIPKAIRGASKNIHEAWQCVNGAHGAIHDALDSFALDLCEANDDALYEGARRLFSALASLRAAEEQLIEAAEAGGAS